MKSSRLLLALAAFALLAVPSAAQAQWGFGPAGYYNGWGNWAAWQPTTVSNYVLPYYSVHPPVYYSPTIIRRPYGTSPFALPPIHQIGAVYSPPTFETSAPAPQVIINPFVEGAADWLPPSTAGSVQAAIAAERVPVAAPPQATIPPPPPGT